MSVIRWTNASGTAYGDIPIHSYPGGEPDPPIFTQDRDYIEKHVRIHREAM